MCRHVGYLGPPVSLARLLLAPRHSLLEQAWDPHDMRGGGTVNADGFGVGWYSGDSSEATRYRAVVPLWTDSAFAALAGQVRSQAVLAAVRSATVGMPVVETACAPFARGCWLFSHNGRVDGWPDSLAKAARELDVVELMTLEAPTDSAVVWALLRQRLDLGADPVSAVLVVQEQVLCAAPGSRLNLLLTDGTTLIATTWTHSLAVRQDRGAVTVASEPFGEPDGWQQIPDRHLVVADREHVDVTALADWGIDD